MLAGLRGASGVELCGWLRELRRCSIRFSDWYSRMLGNAEKCSQAVLIWYSRANALVKGYSWRHFFTLNMTAMRCASARSTAMSALARPTFSSTNCSCSSASATSHMSRRRYMAMRFNACAIWLYW